MNGQHRITSMYDYFQDKLLDDCILHVYLIICNRVLDSSAVVCWFDPRLNQMLSY